MRRWLLSGAGVVLAACALGAAAPSKAEELEVARIYIEYNASGNDLGFHVFVDGEDWRELEIFDPNGRNIFEVEGKGGYHDLGLTELFFEGAEPSLDDVPLDELLALFPEGRYRFVGKTVGDRRIRGRAFLSHAVPAGPEVSASVAGGTVVIEWDPVTGPPEGFPPKAIDVVAYQVIAERFQVTLPASCTSVTLPAEFVAALGTGEHDFEVLAIDISGNQTITEGTFVLE